MKKIIEKWQPKKLAGKIIKISLNILLLLTFFACFVLPFLKTNGATRQYIARVWIICFLLNLHIIEDYKKAREEKRISGATTLLVLLLNLFLSVFCKFYPWYIALGIVFAIGMIETMLTIWKYKTLRFSNRQEIRIFAPSILQRNLVACAFVLSVDLFLLGHAIRPWAVFVFGIIAGILLFCSVMKFLTKDFMFGKTIFGKVAFGIDALCLIALVVYLIYLVPNTNSLRDILLTIVAAAIGGALTLASVVLTINHNEAERIKNETIKAVPLFTCCASLDGVRPINALQAIAVIDPNANHLNIARIVNSDQSNFLLIAIRYSGEWYPITSVNRVIKNQEVYLMFNTPSDTWEGRYIVLKTQDCFENIHYYKISYLPFEANGFFYNTSTECQEVKEDEISC